MNIFKLSIAVLTASVLLLNFTGCSKDDGDSDQSSAKPTCTTPVSELNGDWSSSLTGISNMHVGNCDINFQMENQDLKMDIYTITNKVGTKTLQINSQVVEKVIRRVYKVDLVLLSQNAVDSYNAQSICGYTNWALNVNKDIVNCNALGFNPDTDIKDIFLLEGNIVTDGDTQQIGTDGYPDALDTSYHWTKE